MFYLPLAAMAGNLYLVWWTALDFGVDILRFLCANQLV